MGKTMSTSDFFLSKYNQTTQVQSSTKEMKQCALEMLGTVERPHTSLWISVNGRLLLLLERENDTLLCFVNSHTSQWNSLTSRPLNKEGNNTLRTIKEGWPRRKCWSHNLSLLDWARNDIGDTLLLLACSLASSRSNTFPSTPNHLLRVMFLKFTKSWIQNDTTISIWGEFLNRDKVSKEFRDIKNILEGEMFVYKNILLTSHNGWWSISHCYFPRTWTWCIRNELMWGTCHVVRSSKVKNPGIRMRFIWSMKGKRRRRDTCEG